MPSVISHGTVAVAAGLAFAPHDAPHNFWPVAIVCSILADADTIGFTFGIPYNHFFGHRGFFHSLFFAFLISIFVMVALFSNFETFSRQWFSYFIFFFLLSASHGILDAFTNGALGVALLSPFDSTRFSSPWRPIMASPIDIKSFFSKWGLMVIRSEVLWIWLPSLLLVLVSTGIHKIIEKH
jgi:inner membrane protein